jgi:hypothetical protein
MHTHEDCAGLGWCDSDRCSGGLDRCRAQAQAPRPNWCSGPEGQACPKPEVAHELGTWVDWGFGQRPTEKDAPPKKVFNGGQQAHCSAPDCAAS